MMQTSRFRFIVVWAVTAVLMALSPLMLPPVSAACGYESLGIQQGNYLKAEIPQLVDGLDPEILSQLNDRFRRIFWDAFGQFEKMALQGRNSLKFPEYMKRALTFHARYEVYRSDDRFLSLGQEFYRYTGGAHGMGWLSATTVDLQTGQVCILKDMFREQADYQRRLTEITRREGEARGLPMWSFSGIREDSAYYLTDTELVLYFQHYEIAPYSAGVVRIKIPYGEIRDILSPGIQ